jgi:FkbM family methyltransferase
MKIVSTGRRAIEKYGWRETARRAPRALAGRARGPVARAAVALGAAGRGASLGTRVSRAVLQSGIDPSRVITVVDPVYGTQLVRKGTSDWPTYRQVFVRGDYDFDFGFEPKSIVDLGANVGYSVVYHAVRYPDARIVAVEPDEANARMALANIALGHRRGKIDMLQTAIWHRPTRLEITNPGAPAWAIRVDEARGSGPQTFPATTMGEIMDRFDLPQVDVVKVDIEGGERSLFAENVEWLDRVNALVVEFHDRFAPGCREPVIAAIERYFGEYDETKCGENSFFVRRKVLEAAA